MAGSDGLRTSVYGRSDNHDDLSDTNAIWLHTLRIVVVFFLYKYALRNGIRTNTNSRDKIAHMALLGHLNSSRNCVHRLHISVERFDVFFCIRMIIFLLLLLPYCVYYTVFICYTCAIDVKYSIGLNYLLLYTHRNMYLIAIRVSLKTFDWIELFSCHHRKIVSSHFEDIIAHVVALWPYIYVVRN